MYITIYSNEARFGTKGAVEVIPEPCRWNWLVAGDVCGDRLGLSPGEG